MAGKRQRENGTWEFKFQRKGLLDGPIYFTFDTLEEGESYAATAEALLDRGIVPVEFTGTALKTLADLCSLYEAQATHSKSDAEVIKPLKEALFRVPVTRLSYSWLEGWVDTLKMSLKPSTVVKRVGLLARVVDWGLRRELLTLPNNPVRLLPRGYATKGIDRSERWSGERDRRLHDAAEEARIRAVLKPEEAFLFDMALETAMRLSEMITLTVEQVDVPRRTIFLDKTKNGSKRQVPMSSTLAVILTRELVGKEGWVFSWGALAPAVARNRLSHLYASRFAKAGSPDLRFHDLRHEATARLFERTQLSDTEIASITGHKDPRMLKRYANLRASTLATKMW
jgi:integrase